MTEKWVCMGCHLAFASNEPSYLIFGRSVCKDCRDMAEKSVYKTAVTEEVKTLTWF